MVKKFLKAQALAIVMVVLVISSIIGVALFSRMSKDRMSAISQQDSTLAQEQADAILDIFAGADIVTLEGVLGVAETDFDKISEMKEFLEDIGVDVEVLPEEDWCEGTSNSHIHISLDQTDENDFIEIQPGSVRAYTLDDAIANPGCQLNMRFRSIGDTAVFVIKSVTNTGGVVSEVNENYCITNVESTTCEDVEDVEYEDSLDKGMIWDSGLNAYMKDSGSIDLPTAISNGIVEIRILPISGTLGVSNSLSTEECINKEFRSMKVAAQVTCNGSYRGKQMFLPGSGNLGYSTLFDYAIYDDGLFHP
ncbi:TPA: hypothetical protein DEP90_00425 [Patescibacteria group bacterium]|nr:hypothetical protein [Patescibacteria group bacterium]